MCGEDFVELEPRSEDYESEATLYYTMAADDGLP